MFVELEEPALLWHIHRATCATPRDCSDERKTRPLSDELLGYLAGPSWDLPRPAGRFAWEQKNPVVEGQGSKMNLLVGVAV